MNDSPITGLAPAKGKILIEDAVRKVTKLSEEPWPEFELSGMTTVPLDFPTCMIPGFCPEHHKNQHLPKKYNWPCWFAATCGHLHISVINQQLDGPKELRDSLHWATRVAGYIEQPVDYALAERLFRVKALKVLADVTRQSFLPVASVVFAAFAPCLTVDFKLYGCDNLSSQSALPISHQPHSRSLGILRAGRGESIFLTNAVTFWTNSAFTLAAGISTLLQSRYTTSPSKARPCHRLPGTLERGTCTVAPARCEMRTDCRSSRHI